MSMKKAEQYVKLLDAYIERAFACSKIAEAIKNGELLESEAKLATVLRDTESLAVQIELLTGRKPIDVSTAFRFKGVEYDGEKITGSIDNARRIVRDNLYSSRSLKEYECVCVLWYCTKHKKYQEKKEMGAAAA